NNIRLRYNDSSSALKSKNRADDDQVKNLEHETVSKTVISEQLVVEKNDRKIGNIYKRDPLEILPTQTENHIFLRDDGPLLALEIIELAKEQVQNLEYRCFSKQSVLVEYYKVENVDEENYIIFKEVKYTIKEFCKYPREVNNKFRMEVKDMLNKVQELQKDIEELENFYWYIDFGRFINHED
ncbi:29562_t:CDS:1, partial [Racocetra persica]